MMLQPNNLVNVNELDPANADYLALQAGVVWNARFYEIARLAVLPGLGPLVAGTMACGVACGVCRPVFSI